MARRCDRIFPEYKSVFSASATVLSFFIRKQLDMAKNQEVSNDESGLRLS